MAATTPTVCKMVLGKVLRYHRDLLDLTQDDATHALGRRDANKIVLLEKGQGSLAPAELKILIELYQITDTELISELHRLLANSSHRGRWKGFRKVFGPEFRPFVDMEVDSDHTRMVEVERVPGLLQPRPYIEALFARRAAELGSDSFDDDIRARLSRQEATIFRTEEPPLLEFVMSESCLARGRGGPKVMKAVVNHMIEVGRLGHVRLRLLPFTPPPGRSLAMIGYRFTLLRLQAPGLAGPLEYAYSEGPDDIRLIDEKKTVAAHQALWANLCDAALTPSETEDFLVKYGKGLR